MSHTEQKLVESSDNVIDTNVLLDRGVFTSLVCAIDMPLIRV